MNPIACIAQRIHTHNAHISTKIQHTRGAYVYRGYDLLSATLDSWDSKYRGFIAALRNTLLRMGALHTTHASMTHAPIKWTRVQPNAWRYERVTLYESTHTLPDTDFEYTRVMVGVTATHNGETVEFTHTLTHSGYTDRLKRQLNLKRYIALTDAIDSMDKQALVKIFTDWQNCTYDVR